MRLSDGVEWALHSCLTLDWLADTGPVSSAKLAAAFELPPVYLGKHLQALARAGIVASTPGPRGGFRLARDLENITLLDVVTAIEGADPAFRCKEIRQRGAGASAPTSHYRDECAIAGAMRKAENAWRKALAAQSLAEVRAVAERVAPHARPAIRCWYEESVTTGPRRAQRGG